MAEGKLGEELRKDGHSFSHGLFQNCEREKGETSKEVHNWCKWEERISSSEQSTIPMWQKNQKGTKK